MSMPTALSPPRWYCDTYLLICQHTCAVVKKIAFFYFNFLCDNDVISRIIQSQKHYRGDKEVNREDFEKIDWLVFESRAFKQSNALPLHVADIIYVITVYKKRGGTMK